MGRLEYILCFTFAVFVSDALSCTYNGQEYAIGVKFQSIDGCNECVCGAIGVVCTKMMCEMPTSVKPVQTTTQPPKSCTQTVGGVATTYADGESFKAADGCNTCLCRDGNAMCTLMACLTDGTCTDPSTGQVYNGGDTFAAADGCNKCNCFNSVISCTEMACSSAAQCFDAATGKVYKSGEMFAAPDGCNSCTCKDGVIACTKKFCSGN